MVTLAVVLVVLLVGLVLELVVVVVLIVARLFRLQAALLLILGFGAEPSLGLAHLIEFF